MGMLNLRFASHHFLDTARIAARSRAIPGFAFVRPALSLGARRAFDAAFFRDPAFICSPPSRRRAALANQSPAAIGGAGLGRGLYSSARSPKTSRTTVS